MTTGIRSVIFCFQFNQSRLLRRLIDLLDLFFPNLSLTLFEHGWILFSIRWQAMVLHAHFFRKEMIILVLTLRRHSTQLNLFRSHSDVVGVTISRIHSGKEPPGIARLISFQFVPFHVRSSNQFSYLLQKTPRMQRVTLKGRHILKIFER